MTQDNYSGLTQLGHHVRATRQSGYRNAGARA